MPAHVSEAVFRVAYDGEAVLDGEMDVADLAPALLGLAQLIKAAGRVLDGDDAQVSVRVKATNQACFEVWLSVAVDGASAAWTFWKSEDTQAAANLLMFLGLGGGGATAGVIWAVRKLKGGKARRARASDGSVVLIAEDGTEIEVLPPVADLVEDSGVRAALEVAIAEPLEREGIESISFGRKGDEEKVAKREAEYFKAPAVSESDVFESRHTKAFSLVTLSFKTGQKWRLNDGGTQRAVQMSDPEFLARVDNNEVAFRKGDLLICEVIETARRTQTGFKNEYEIVRVLEHRKAVPHPDLLEGTSSGGGGPPA